MKTKIIPFNLETAKKIQAGEIEGRIKCNEREFHRILCFDAIGLYPIVALLYDGVDEVAFSFSKNGYFRSSTAMKLFIELPEEAPKHKFKPFDKVLVRENNGQVWHCDFYSYTDSVHGMHYCVGHCGEQILPYEGNEYLVGTIDKPKEE